MNYVVCGPPGSGKTTWVMARARWGDVVLDVDALFVAVTGLRIYEKPEALLRLVLELQETTLRWMERNPERFVNGWVIAGGAKVNQRARLARRLGVTEAEGVIVLETSPDECLRRIAADPRRKNEMSGWAPLVHKWWSEYERGAGLRIANSSAGRILS